MLDAPAATAPPPQPVDSDTLPAPRVAIGLPVAAAFVVILNETITGVAIPRLVVEFDISAASAQWLTRLPAHHGCAHPHDCQLRERFTTRALFHHRDVALLDRHPRRPPPPRLRVFVRGRVVQAMGTALMVPLLTTTILKPYPRNRGGDA